MFQKKWIPGLFLFVSLICLRLQVRFDLELGFPEAIESGLIAGLFNDAVVLFFPIFLSIFWEGLTKASRLIPYCIGASLVWLAALSNVWYFRFYSGNLEWWIVQDHTLEVIQVLWAERDLLSTSRIVLSTLFFISTLVLRYLQNSWELGDEPQSVRAKQKEEIRALRSIGVSALVVVGALLLRQSPRWFKIDANSKILSQQVFTLWAEEIIQKQKKRDPVLANVMVAASKIDYRPTEVLAHYRDYNEAEVLNRRASPFNIYRGYSPEEIAEVRNQFGLPVDQKINIIVLFLDSVRAFEVSHDSLKETIFPELNDILKKNAYFFKQAYSSVSQSALSARTQFSVLCSSLPNFLGPAVYSSYSNLKVDCLPALLKPNGYHTAWFSTLDKNDDHVFKFGKTHGTKDFYDRIFFEDKKITKKVGQWGLADGLFLQEALSELIKISETSSFFASVVTASTRPPYGELAEAKVPFYLRKEISSQSYRGYLSHLRYLDKSLKWFFDEFFKSPLSENTLIALVGTHGSKLAPHLPMSDRQKIEIQFRVPIALISKNIKNPRIFYEVVHQVDLAPTLAKIAGISSKVSWVGSGLLSGPGRPFVYHGPHQFAYRTQSKSCYQWTGKNELRCWRVSEKDDPLFSLNLEETHEEPELSSFFKKVVHSNRQAITLNRLKEK